MFLGVVMKLSVLRETGACSVDWSAPLCISVFALFPYVESYVNLLIYRDDNVQRELRDWGLSFDSNLLSFSGRILQAEKIHQGGKTVRQFLPLSITLAGV